jgi:protein SCO1/2
MKRVLLLPLALLLALLCAGPARSAPIEGVGITQMTDALLPLDAPLVDEKGRAVRLGDYFGTHPVVLVFGYFRCPNLCSTVMASVLEALKFVDLPSNSYQLISISIDPDETPQIAAKKKAEYVKAATGAYRLHLLTGSRETIARLTQAAGFHYRKDSSTGLFVHAAGFIVVKGDGRIFRYFFGVRFNPPDVRLSLVDASRGAIGTAVDRLILFCCNYDPAKGRYTVAIMNVIRVIAFFMVALLGGWIWRHRRGRHEP